MCVLLACLLPSSLRRKSDCGAGIGRVTKHLLLDRFDAVDIVEQSPRLIQAAPKYVGRDRDRTTCLCVGLQVREVSEGTHKQTRVMMLMDSVLVLGVRGEVTRKYRRRKGILFFATWHPIVCPATWCAVSKQTTLKSFLYDTTHCLHPETMRRRFENSVRTRVIDMRGGREPSGCHLLGAARGNPHPAVVSALGSSAPLAPHPRTTV